MQARHAHGESEAGTELLDLPEPADLEVTGGTAAAGTDVFETADGAALLSDPFADDLGDKLKSRKRLRLNAKSTVVLAALVLLTAGFLAGAQVQKHYGVATPAGARGPGGWNMGASGFNRGSQGGAGQPWGQNGSQQGGAQGGGAPGSAAGGVTTGTVKMVDGNTVYVTTSDGKTVIVRTSSSTNVQIGQKGALTDITAGAQITVEGQTGTDGALTASKVTKN